MQQEKQATVKTKDQQDIIVAWDLIKYHSTIFAELDVNLKDDPHKPIDIEVNAKEFNYIYQALQKQGQNNFNPLPKPIPSDKIKEFLSPEDYEFVQKVDDSDIQQISKACQYLGIQHLFELCLVYIGSFFVGKTVNEIREYFQIEEEYTSELEEKIKQDFQTYFQGCNIQGDIQVQTAQQQN